MKARVKGLLALCLAMCMVLAMTTVAFGEDTEVYFVDISDSEGVWTKLTVTTVVKSFKPVEGTSGVYSSFYVVDKDGNYVKVGSGSGVLYFDADQKAEFTFDEDFVKAWLGEDVDPNDYTFYMKRGTIPVGNAENTPVEEPADESEQDSGENTQQIATYGLKVNNDADSEMKKLVIKPDTNETTGNVGNLDNGIENFEIDPSNSTVIATAPPNALMLKAELKPTETVMSHTPIRRQQTTAVEEPVTQPEATTVASPKTFDAGIAVYAGLSLLSATGVTVVIGRKKEF